MGMWMELVRYRWACSIKVSAARSIKVSALQMGMHYQGRSHLMMTDDDQTMYCSIQVLCFESVPISVRYRCQLCQAHSHSLHQGRSHLSSRSVPPIIKVGPTYHPQPESIRLCTAPSRSVPPIIHSQNQSDMLPPPSILWMESVRYRWACLITYCAKINYNVSPHSMEKILCFESVPISPHSMEPHPSVAMGPSSLKKEIHFSLPQPYPLARVKLQVQNPQFHSIASVRSSPDFREIRQSMLAAPPAGRAATGERVLAILAGNGSFVGHPGN
jgi:hypothetical protein